MMVAYFDKPEFFTVYVQDATGYLAQELKEGENYRLILTADASQSTIEESNAMESGESVATMIIPADIFSSKEYEIFSYKQMPPFLTNNINSDLEHIMESYNKRELFKKHSLSDFDRELQDTKVHLSQRTLKKSEDGVVRESMTELAAAIGGVMGFLMYIFVLMYGSMVMQAVLEEKTNRVIEIIVSSVKPLHFMLGKILGVALVGITQLAAWVLLSVGILGVTSLFFGASSLLNPETVSTMTEASATANPEIFTKVTDVLSSLDFSKIIIGFIIFFIGGYLLYSSMMAALASAVNSTEDAGQFTTPLMMPIILSLMIMTVVINNPNGNMAIFFSYFPLTSPIIMCSRIPFDVSWWEILLSFTILAISTFGALWVSAKIYRTGILMYGKKPSWKEILKWIRVKHY